MNSCPTIVGFRLIPLDGQAGETPTLAVLTVETWPWIIRGLRLCRCSNEPGFFFKPPVMARNADRIVLRPSAERDGLLDRAVAMLRQLAPHLADPPLATASSDTS